MGPDLILLIHNNNKVLNSYFAPAQSYFSEIGKKFLSFSHDDIGECWKDLKSEENIVFLEFSDDVVTREFIKERLSKINSLVYLIVDYSLLKDESSLEFFQLCQNSSEISGWIDVSRAFELYIPLIRSMVRDIQTKIEVQKVQDLEKNLNKLVRHTLVELTKVRNLHEKLVPFRKEEIKGLSISSKYSVGTSLGGEFFDIIQSDNSLVLLLTTSSSYVISSIVLSHFEDLKLKTDFRKEALEGFLEDLSGDVKKTASVLKNPKDNPLEALLVKIDLKNLNVSGYHFGGAQLVSDSNHHRLGNNFPIDKSFFDSAHFSFVMERGHKYVIVSSGVRKSTNDIVDKQNLADYVKDQIWKGSGPFLNELFYQLKKGKASRFLEYDASAIYLEVNNNVIVQV